MSQKQSDPSINDRVKQAAQRLIDKDPYLNPWSFVNGRPTPAIFSWSET
jgi:hypothetical protein